MKKKFSETQRLKFQVRYTLKSSTFYPGLKGSDLIQMKGNLGELGLYISLLSKVVLASFLQSIQMYCFKLYC